MIDGLAQMGAFWTLSWLQMGGRSSFSLLSFYLSSFLPDSPCFTPFSLSPVFRAGSIALLLDCQSPSHRGVHTVLHEHS